ILLDLEAAVAIRRRQVLPILDRRLRNFALPRVLGHHNLVVQDRPGGRRKRRPPFFQEAGRRLPRTADEERCGRGGNGRQGERRASWTPPYCTQHTDSPAARGNSR